MQDDALDGLKVADFSWVITGPLVARYLADHGAIVVHAESRRALDVVRLCPPFKASIVPTENSSAMYTNYNSNKYGIGLNLANRKGQEIAKRLVAWSDIVLESFSPGVMERWGLGYEVLRQIKNEIIMMSISLQGTIGPRVTQPGYGSQIASLVGFPELTGWPDRDPGFVFGAYLDFLTPRFACAALLAALDYRGRTGKGTYIKVSQYEASCHFITPLLLDYQVNGRINTRKGNRCSFAAPHGVYRCRGEDRWCAIAVLNDGEWENFCEAIGRHEWISDGRFATLLAMKRNEDELDKLIEEWTIDFSPEEVTSLLQAKGIAAAIVHNFEGLHGDPQLKYRDHFWKQDHPEIGIHTVDSPGFRLSKTPAKLRMPAPLLCQHTYQVCSDILGISDEEFTELLTEGVIE